MTKTNAAQLAALERDMHWQREQTAALHRKQDQQSAAIREILDRSRGRDEDVKELKVTMGQMNKKLADMEPHVRSVAETKRAVRLAKRAGVAAVAAVVALAATLGWLADRWAQFSRLFH